MIQTVGINQIAKRHYAWVDRMGWHNKTVLEALALISSEIGEAADITSKLTGACAPHLAGSQKLKNYGTSKKPWNA